MKKYTKEELKVVLELHRKWLNNEKDGIYANLRSADLRFAIGEMISLRSLQIEKYMVSYTDTILNIGCQSYTIEEWKNFDDEQISKFDDGALEWWTKWKTIIFQIIEMLPAEPTGY